MRKGFSLIEILVVLTIFSFLAIVSTQAVLLTLRGAKKSDTSGRVRQNVDYAIATMERQVHNAQNITPCPNPSTTTATIIDQNGQSSILSCVNIGQPTGYVASASARLTGTDITITSCSFVCNPANGTIPPSLTISIGAKDAVITGPEGGQVSTSTTVYLRSY